MIWINLIVIVFILIIGPFVRGCDKIIVDPPVNENRIYFNSFESLRDTIGWKGEMQFRNDAPRRGGKQSAYISGGCIHPHAYYQLPSSTRDRKLRLRCWGKNLAIGGNIELEARPEEFVIEIPRKIIYISIMDSLWDSYEPPTTLICPANYKLFLSMSAGGIVPSSMLVDLLEVMQVH